MSRSLFLDLADKGLAMPLAVDLLVHSLSSPGKVDHDPAEMARVMVAAARTFRTPMAVAPMDLRVEKAAFGDLMGMPAGELETYHINDPLRAEQVKALPGMIETRGVSRRMETTCAALAHVAREEKSLVPTGMVIGPFSLLTKLMNEAISAVYMIGQEMDPDDDPLVELALQLLPLATAVSCRYARAQVQAGARAIIMCEPAANKVYISPKLIEAGSDIFRRIVLEPCRQVKDTIEAGGADLILHDCGELIPEMVELLASLRPSMLSLGSCTDIVAATARVPKDVTLFGNVPSKFFPLETEMPLEKVEGICADLRTRMAATGHPYILGSECDILSVTGKEATIRAKTDVIARQSRM